MSAKVHGWHVPGWATPHNLALLAGAAVAVVVIIGLLRVAGRLSKLAKPAAPAPAPKPSGFSGKALLGVVAAAGAGWFLLRHKTGTAAKAAPAPVPAPTVTVTAPPKTAPVHFTPPHIPFPHLTGTQWTVIAVVALLVAYSIVRPLLRRSS